MSAIKKSAIVAMAVCQAVALSGFGAVTDASAIPPVPGTIHMLRCDGSELMPFASPTDTPFIKYDAATRRDTLAVQRSNGPGTVPTVFVTQDGITRSLPVGADGDMPIGPERAGVGFAERRGNVVLSDISNGIARRRTPVMANDQVIMGQFPAASTDVNIRRGLHVYFGLDANGYATGGTFGFGNDVGDIGLSAIYNGVQTVAVWRVATRNMFIATNTRGGPTVTMSCPAIPADAVPMMADLNASGTSVPVFGVARSANTTFDPANPSMYLSGPAPAGTPAAGWTALRAAAKKIGAPYRLGAAGEADGNGVVYFDCSGLTQWAYHQAGVSIPRITLDQRKTPMMQVQRDQIRPGDLVHFKGAGPNKAHVAMFVGRDVNGLAWFIETWSSQAKLSFTSTAPSSPISRSLDKAVMITRPPS